MARMQLRHNRAASHRSVLSGVYEPPPGGKLSICVAYTLTLYAVLLTNFQMEEVKRREMQLYQLKKKIAENESKLKQQQTLYEAVCSDRNLCSKNLIEARDEITEMKRKLKIMSHQIDQLKEEIASKVLSFSPPSLSPSLPQSLSLSLSLFLLSLPFPPSSPPLSLSLSLPPSLPPSVPSSSVNILKQNLAEY
jgi:hypothetical protein